MFPGPGALRTSLVKLSVSPPSSQLGAEGPAEEDGATGWGPERRVRSAVTQNCHRKKGILSSVKSLGCGSYLSQQLEHPDTQPSRNL